MKELWLYRHAKTEKAGFGIDDKLRKLLPEGEKAAAYVGGELARYKHVPELVFTSSSERAHATALLATQAMGFKGSIEVMPWLYNAEVNDIIKLLTNKSEDRIMIVGHNPCVEECLERFGGTYERMRPGTCAWLSFGIENWSDLSARVLANEIHLYRPKESGL